MSIVIVHSVCGTSGVVVLAVLAVLAVLVVLVVLVVLAVLNGVVELAVVLRPARRAAATARSSACWAALVLAMKFWAKMVLYLSLVTTEPEHR